MSRKAHENKSSTGGREHRLTAFSCPPLVYVQRTWIPWRETVRSGLIFPGFRASVAWPVLVQAAASLPAGRYGLRPTADLRNCRKSVRARPTTDSFGA